MLALKRRCELFASKCSSAGRRGVPQRLQRRPFSHPHPLAAAGTWSCKLAKASLGERDRVSGLRRFQKSRTKYLGRSASWPAMSRLAPFCYIQGDRTVLPALKRQQLGQPGAEERCEPPSLLQKETRSLSLLRESEARSQPLFTHDLIAKLVPIPECTGTSFCGSYFRSLRLSLSPGEMRPSCLP